MYSAAVPTYWKPSALGLGLLAVNVVAAKGDCREQNAWRHSDSAWTVRSCVGRVHVYDHGKGRRHRTDSRYSRKDSQRSAASHRGRGGAHWRRYTSRGRQKGIDLAVSASGPPISRAQQTNASHAAVLHVFDKGASQLSIQLLCLGDRKS